jgi:hypothetical protein
MTCQASNQAAKRMLLGTTRHNEKPSHTHVLIAKCQVPVGPGVEHHYVHRLPAAFAAQNESRLQIVVWIEIAQYHVLAAALVTLWCAGIAADHACYPIVSIQGGHSLSRQSHATPVPLLH